MPLYLVRWPDLAASLVTAEDEDDLVDTLDEIANPDGCKWKVYRGPLFIHFELPARVEVDWPENAKGPLQAEYLRVENVEELCTGAPLQASLPDGSDTALAMREEILRFAFPNLNKLIESAEGRESMDREAVRSAVKDDALLLVSSSWRAAQLRRSTDPDAQLAAAMDAPLSLVRYWRARTARVEAEPPKPPPNKTSGKRPKKRR
jgi:hypothetical protein